MKSIPAEQAAERATVLGLEGALLYTEGRYHEGEAEYLKSLDAWEESGHGKTTDMTAVLASLAALHAADGRYHEASRTLDRASAILTSAKDAVATDWIKLLSTRAALHIQQREWREAEADLRGKEARPIEVRAAALQARDLTTGVVDISELLAKSRNVWK